MNILKSLKGSYTLKIKNTHNKMNTEVFFQLTSIALVVIAGPAVIGILYAQKGNL